MEIPFLVKIELLILLIILSGFFSSSEAAIFSIRPKIQTTISEGRGYERYLKVLFDNPASLIITILIGNEFVNISASVLMASICIDAFGANGKWISVLIMTPLILLFAELIPKTVAIKYADKISLFLAIPVYVFYRIVFPVRALLLKISDFTNRVFPGPDRKDKYLTEEEIRFIVDIGEREGVLDPDEKELIFKVFEFGETKVSEIMTPRTDVFSLSYDLSLEKIVEEVSKRRFSRIPIYKNYPDNIIGILHAKDLLVFYFGGSLSKAGSLKELLRPPYFIPETKKAYDLFNEFNQKRMHMAVVVDEYGGFAGIVTMEDLLEELFGEIKGESESVDTMVEMVSDSEYLVKAKIPIDEFSRMFNLSLPEGDFETLGGFVLHLFGRLPKKDEFVEYDGMRFIVEKIRGTRILVVRFIMGKRNV